jgi:uncharacterized NAD(P)/FAD-binding protein YdhS
MAKKGRFRTICKACERLAFRERIDLMAADERTAFMRSRNAASKESRHRCRREWESSHRAARAAQKAVRQALLDGLLKRPDGCARCGRTEAPRLVAHHRDYSRPLDVEFICDRCHRKHHQEQAA